MDGRIQQLPLIRMITGKRNRMITKIILKTLKKITMFSSFVIWNISHKFVKKIFRGNYTINENIFYQPCDLTQASSLYFRRDDAASIGKGYLLKVPLIPWYFGRELGVHNMFWQGLENDKINVINIRKHQISSSIKKT